MKVNQPTPSTILGLEVIETEFNKTQKLTSHSEGTDLQIIELIQTESDTGDFLDTNAIS